MPVHSNDPTKLSTNTLINDDHNGSFEDEDLDDDHHHHDQPDNHQYPQQSNHGPIAKAQALYDFNGKTHVMIIIEKKLIHFKWNMF